jgi:hypothetical protein
MFLKKIKMKVMLTMQNRVLQVKAGRTRATSSSVVQHQLALSQGIIPAVRGEYYSYPSVFTEERPFYVLMKCKSNKARLVCEAANLGSEINAFFQFKEEYPRILSIKAADALGLLEEIVPRVVFNDTWFAPTSLTAEQFLKLRSGRKTEELLEVCQKVLVNRQVVTELHEDLVVALTTGDGKYGMFLVEEVTPSLIQIEACHILL